MSGFPITALASIAAGLFIGATATVGATMAAADDQPPPRVTPATSGLHPVGYGDRCYRGYCVPDVPAPPCDSWQSCRRLLP